MGKTALIFPGQGSQTPHMGQEIAEHYPEAMKYWIQAEEYSELPLRKIYWETCSQEEMVRTQALQPALTAYALSLLHTRKYTYDAVAGHSLGEFPALFACGALSADAVLYLTAKRGLLMDNVDPQGKGSMIAILKLELAMVEEIVATVRSEYGESIFIANYNTPAQYILSGEQRVFERIKELTQQAKGKALPLAIGGAFHSPMMQKAQEDFIPYLQEVEWNTPHVPFYSNVTASPLTNPTDIQHAMEKQITSPVYFINLLHAMHSHGITNFIEVCAKSICTSFVKTTLGTDITCEVSS
ncbi:MAG: ACP S-malonyltransferase [Desulfovibrionaceae bacterium]|nr:ACP S-malonyltransferase [Desulfovibrionaceae bacterium]